MEHKRLNRIIAAVIFAIGLVTYGLTVAPTTSYWDCGEFITCSYILGVPHPPGAPLYILIGRIFTMFPLFEDIGLRVNFISVLASALSIMFTYLIIIRLLREWKGTPQNLQERITVYTGGIIGALGFAFTDSFWFNAVEAEVYAVSMFFTAIVVWLILVWVEKADEPVSDKILFLIAYLIGLATGVHLLNILALPTIFLIVYFKRAELNLTTFVLWALGGVAAFAAIYPGIVKGIPWVLDSYGFWAVAVLALIMVFATAYAIQNQRRLMSMILMSITLVAIGYSTYTMIYIRSGMEPAINENNPSNPERFASYMNREQYGDIPMTERRAPVWEYQIKKMYVRYFGWQFIGKGTNYGADGYISDTLSTKGLMGLPFIVGLIGMFFHFQRDWKRASAVLTLFIMTGIAIAIYLNQEDPQPRERDYAYVGSFFAFALWIGIGASAVMETVYTSIHRSQILRKIGVALAIILLIVAVPANLLQENFHSHDRSGNYVAYDYSYNILQSCEPNAIIFTNGDNDTFPLWFLQYVYGIRQDVRVVNLSLLNTPWYIKQLRDEEPRVPINMSDDQVDKLGPMHWPETKTVRIPVPREKAIEYLEKSNDNSGLSKEDIPQSHHIEFEFANTQNFDGYPVILTQDRMVVHIIGANEFEKPIYFAVTVSPTNMLGLDNRNNPNPNYLRMDGLTFRVMPYGGPTDFISPQRMHANLFENFRYRNLDNPDVYYNRNILGLLQNYRSAFIRLAGYYQQQALEDPEYKEKALDVLNRMNEVMPEEVIPLRNYQLSLNFGRMYAEAGQTDVLREKLQQIPNIYNLAPQDWLYLAQYYNQFLDEPATAESLGLSVLNKMPDSIEPYGWLLSFYSSNGQYNKAIDILEQWLAKNPTDQNAQAQLQRLKTLAARDSVSKPQPDTSETNSQR